MKPILPSLSAFTALLLAFLAAPVCLATAETRLQKDEDIVIYQDPGYYAAFPSVVKRDSGELIVAFRRAPDWRSLGGSGISHTDPNSYLVLVRSHDNGKTWTEDPELIFAHPYGGSQDPCMIQLKDGTIVCSSYGWAHVRDDKAAQKIESTLRHGNFIFMGGYLMRSTDGGKQWEGPILPPPLEVSVTKDVWGKPVPSYNRGAMCEGADGNLYWAVATQSRLTPRLTEVHLLVSEDKGTTWEYRCPIAQDDTASFNETSLYETPSGDLVAFLRTADFDDHTVIARSTDHGKSFQPWEDTGFQGHPHFALRLPDNRVFLIYGYRHPPYGIRARVLNAECTDAATAEEIVLREDGGSGDLGYPWATMMDDGRVLATYYFNKADGTRHIAGTILSIIEE